MVEFDEYFLDYDDMIEWFKRYIKRNFLWRILNLIE